MAGKKGRSGRKKSASTLAREALERNEQMLPTYLQILHDIVGDEAIKDKTIIDTCKYLIDRAVGRVKATHDLRFGQGATMDSDYYARASRLTNWVEVEQALLLHSLGKDVPESLIERNEIVKVLSVQYDFTAGSVEAEFKLPSGDIERRRGEHYGWS